MKKHAGQITDYLFCGPENASDVFLQHYVGRIKNATIATHLGLCLGKTRSVKKHDNLDEKIQSTKKSKSRRFQIPLFEERFRKAPFL